MKKHISLILSITLLVLAITGCSAPAASAPAQADASAPKQKITLIIGSGHGEACPWIKAAQDFFEVEVAKRVAEKTNYEIEWVESYGGSVITLGNELEGARDGLVDIACVMIPFEASRLPLEASSFSCPFSCPDPMVACKVITALLNEFPEITADFDKYNLKLIGAGITDQYGLWSNKKVEKIEDLAGMKIGVAGLNSSWIEGSGAIGVQTNLNEVYQNIQTNVCQATTQPTHTCVNVKLYEAAKYYLDAEFNVITPALGLSVNKTKLASLPQEVQDIIVQTGGEFLEYECNYINTLHQQDIETMKANGCEVTTISWELKQAWAATLNDVVHDHIQTLNAAGYDGSKFIKRYYELLEENGIPKVRDWNMD